MLFQYDGVLVQKNKFDDGLQNVPLWEVSWLLP